MKGIKHFIYVPIINKIFYKSIKNINYDLIFDEIMEKFSHISLLSQNNFSYKAITSFYEEVLIIIDDIICERISIQCSNRNILSFKNLIHTLKTQIHESYQRISYNIFSNSSFYLSIWNTDKNNLISEIKKNCLKFKYIYSIIKNGPKFKNMSISEINNLENEIKKVSVSYILKINKL